MNGTRFEGICRRFAGKMKEVWGELSGDTKLVAAGRRDQIVGQAQQASAMEREAAARQLRDFQHLHRNWHV